MTIDILIILCFGGFMCYKPDQPNWLDRGRFILSKGNEAAHWVESGHFDLYLKA